MRCSAGSRRRAADERPRLDLAEPVGLHQLHGRSFGENAASFWREFGNSLLIAVVAVVGDRPVRVDGRLRLRPHDVPRPGGPLHDLRVRAAVPVGGRDPAAVHHGPRRRARSTTRSGVALPQAAFALPITIIILRPFFRSIPTELEDAARIDGCGPFGFFWRVLLPLSRPALATVAVLAIVASWNAFLLPAGGAQRRRTWTLPLGVMNFSTEFSTRLGPGPRLHRARRSSRR